MKFFALAASALIATSGAIRLTQVPAQAQLVSAMATMPMKLDDMFAALDTNKDGVITIHEVIGTIKAYAKAHDFELPKGWKKEVKQMFKSIDADKNGKVTMDEVKAAVFNAVDQEDKNGVKDG